MVLICKNLCENYSQANKQDRGKINYDLEKFCSECRYSILKIIFGSTCPCCGQRYRFKNRNGRRLMQNNKESKMVIT